MAHLIRLTSALLFAVMLLLLVACDGSQGADTPAPPSGDKPVVTILKPASGISVQPNERIPIYAVTQATKGIRRVEMLVNDALVDRQSLNLSTRRFDYQPDYQFTVIGQHRLTVVAYDVDGVASDPVSIVVNVGAPGPTDTTAPTVPTETPYVLYVTATPAPPPSRTFTPYVLVVTATPLPTRTRTPTQFVVVVTATPPGSK